MRRGLLPRRLPLFLVRQGLRFPWTVIVLSLAAWIAAGVVVTHARVQTDILSLVPSHNRVVSEFRTTLDRFGSVDLLLVVVRLDPKADLEGELAFEEELGGRLRSWKQIDWVEYRMEDPAALVRPLLDRATLFLGPRRVDDLLAGLDAAGLERRARWLRARLTGPQGLVAKNLLREDPLGLLPDLLGRIKIGGLGAHFDPATGYMIDPGRHLLLMLARPVRPAQDLEFDRQLMRGFRDRVRRAAAAWRAAGWEDEPPRVEAAGGYVTALEDGRLIVTDLAVGAATSLIGVLILFLFAFRRPGALLFASAPLVTGLALTFIFAGLLRDRLNAVTSAFAALLIGLGIDFVIVLYGRYVEEIRAGSSHRDAAEVMGRNTGVGVLLGAVTTAATFYAFTATDFRGLADLGLLTGTGILLVAASVFLLLPALLTVSGRVSRRERTPYLHSFGSDALCCAALARRKLTTGVVVVVTVALGAAAFTLHFDDDIRNMRSANNRGVILRQEIMKRFGLRFSPMMVRVDGRTEDEAFARARVLLEAMEPLDDGRTLAGIDSIADLVPSTADQEAVIRRLEKARIDVDAVLRRLSVALEHAGLNPAAFESGMQHLRAALTVRRPISLGDLEGARGKGELARIVGRYVAKFPGGVSTVIYCYAPAGRWRRVPPPALERVVAAHPWAALSGVNVISRELRRIVWGDAERAAIIGLAAVFLLLWLDFGSLRATLLALLPLAVGMVWMLGAMAIFRLAVNLMNIFVFTMVIGIGVDYGVHLLHRWRESGGDGTAVAQTAKAIAVAALTTVVGFGSLVLSHYPGLRSVGAAAILGALTTATLATTLLPAILAGRRR